MSVFGFFRKLFSGGARNRQQKLSDRDYYEKGFAFATGRSSQPKWSNYNIEEAIETAYEKSFYLNTCVDIIAESVASVPMMAFQRNRNSGTWEPDPNSALQAFLERPNENFTARMLLELLASHVILAGNHLWRKLYVNGQLVEIWPLNQDDFKIHLDNQNLPAFYEHTPTRQRIKAAEIVHFRRTNVRDLYWGAGQLEVGRRLFDFDSSSLDWNKVVVENRGVVPGYLGVKTRLLRPQIEELREEMKKRRIGGEKEGEDLILGSDISYHRVGQNPDEMDWLESRRLTRQDICMFMRVPPPMVGIYDDATLANIEQARKIFWQDRLMPFLQIIEDAINLYIVPEFGDPNVTYAGFDDSEIQAIRESRFEQARVANVLVRIGWAPRAVNRELGMGYRDEDIVDGFLVEGINTVGTAAGTRGTDIRSQIKENFLKEGEELEYGLKLAEVFQAEQRIAEQYFADERESSEARAPCPPVENSLERWIGFFAELKKRFEVAGKVDNYDPEERAIQVITESFQALASALKGLDPADGKACKAVCRAVYAEWQRERVKTLLQRELRLLQDTVSNSVSNSVPETVLETGRNGAAQNHPGPSGGSPNRGLRRRNRAHLRRDNSAGQ